MKKRNPGIIAVVLILLAFIGNSCSHELSTKTETNPAAIDLIEVREILQELDDQFAEDFNNADSIALAEHYSSDGTFGSVKGKENLMSAWGKYIRYASKKGTPNVKYQISSVSSHGEFVVEVGAYEFADTNDIVKSTGKYLVVRKLEDGQWKMYRDIGL